MFQSITAWAAANSSFVTTVLLTAICVAICCVVFPQDGAGGDFDFFGGDAGGDGGGD
jgi:hypothetical protein